MATTSARSPRRGRRRSRSTRIPSRLRDVARAAGVSTATVSRVINDAGGVSDASRRRVERAVQKLHYYPNAHARSLASGRSQQIGLLISDIANPFFPELVKSIEGTASRRGFEVVLAETEYDPERLTRAVRRFLERDVAGVIIMASELELAAVERLSRRQVALVLLDAHARGERTSTISVDYGKGIDEAVRHLAALGHCDIAYIGGPGHLRSAAMRRAAFEAAVHRHVGAGSHGRLCEADFRLEGGFEAAAAILGRVPRPTALVAANDLMALGATKACRAQRVQVPGDVSIVGFDDIAFAGLADPPLSTVCLPRGELGRLAVEALLGSLDGGARRPLDVVVPTYFVSRESTGPAAPTASATAGSRPR